MEYKIQHGLKAQGAKRRTTHKRENFINITERKMIQYYIGSIDL